jgi:hypothetical protein
MTTRHFDTGAKQGRAQRAGLDLVADESLTGGKYQWNAGFVREVGFNKRGKVADGERWTAAEFWERAGHFTLAGAAVSGS